MIEFKTGNIFDENVEALVNPVHCVGVMGKGLALEFKKRFPENFDGYLWACKRDYIEIGRIFQIKDRESGVRIFNFPTKHHWKDKSRLEYIESGLAVLYVDIPFWGIKSIAIPALGCGLGGLQWLDVKKLIEKELEPLDDVRIVVFEPKETK